MNRILITGASGFIGTNLLEHFKSKGYEVINIDFNKPKIKGRERFWKNVDITKYELF
ncbi:MAG: NAD-dependent epimerase/dehydratase family protein [Oliverpabstia sp.]|nr:NAD-dependent epimerase/dehydratase family protein [Oliverpabstia sp.]